MLKLEKIFNIYLINFDIKSIKVESEMYKTNGFLYEAKKAQINFIFIWNIIYPND